MKATINNDGTLVLFPTTQVEAFACKTLLCRVSPPTIVMDSQPYMNEPDYVKKINAQNQTKGSGA